MQATRLAMRRLRAGAALPALAVLLGGCTTIGATRMGIDRSDYANRLRETNKEQLLLNIVAMRYGDAPLFLEVSSVISQYSREGSVHADVALAPPPGDTEGAIGGSIVLRETPTVTYTPLSGDRFSRSLLSPLPPASLLAMIESGWSADWLLRIAARSINGVSSGARDPLFAHATDPAFEAVLAALGRLQRGGAVVIHVEHDGGKFTAIARPGTPPTAQDNADLALLARALNLPGDRKGNFTIVFGAGQTAPDQIAIGTRSMFEIFSEMAQGVEVPASDQARAVAPASGEAAALIHVHSGDAAPADAHAAVRYRGHWFWIDGGDAGSKRMFLIAQILLSLTDTSAGANAPLVTIPTG